MKKFFLLFLSFTAVSFASCLSSKSAVGDAKATPSSLAAGDAAVYTGLKRKVAIARFSNETKYAKGSFYDKNEDPLGRQAMEILHTKLGASNKFILLERNDLNLLYNEETQFSGGMTRKIGADYLILGSLTKYGRNNTGESGVFSRTKRQTVEAGVSIRLVDVSSGQIIYAEEASGSAETETSTVMGIGNSSSFDDTLSDKAISAAISQLVENIINNCMDRPWKSYFLSYDDDMILMAGGKKQGIRVGDTFVVLQRGKTVKNPQTGMTMELPGKEVGTVRVLQSGGTDEVNEWSLVELTGAVNRNNLDGYMIQEKK